MTALPATPDPPLSGAADLTEDDALTLLERGDLELEGRLVDASNTTLRAFLTFDGVTARCVYKPVRGERPLWDFPDGTLAGREVAAYLVSRAGGWEVVPPTVLRDGPLGPGACQLWIDEPEEEPGLVGFVPARKVPAGWHAVLSAGDERGRRYALVHANDPRLAAMAAFDAVANNADRKGGHVLVGTAGRVYGVDHGVCFHVQDKLRTILWGWAGEPLPDPVREQLERLSGALGGSARGSRRGSLSRAETGSSGRAEVGRSGGSPSRAETGSSGRAEVRRSGGSEAEFSGRAEAGSSGGAEAGSSGRSEVGSLASRLVEHLTPAEVTALGVRVNRLLQAGRFPAPAGHRPAVPWPPI